MGSPEDEWGRGANTENQVKVTLTRSFLLQRTEVTQADWTVQGLPNPSAPPTKPNNSGDCLQPECPVGNVTWWEAVAYANLLSSAAGLPECYLLEDCTGPLGSGMSCTGLKLSSPTIYDCPGYRLPTGPEWEYAAKAGTSTTFYTGQITPTTDPLSCGNDVDVNLEKAAWYCFNSGDLTHPVGGKVENAWGLVDMLGNAWEWSSTEIKSLGYGNEALVDPYGVPLLAEAPVLRGGGPISPAATCAPARQFFDLDRSSRVTGFGFRLARTLIGVEGGSANGGVDASGVDSSL